MGIIKQYLDRKKIHNDAAAYWRERGAKIGKDCDINPYANLGSEPYLIEIGDHVRVCHKVEIYTHDGGLWVIRDYKEGCKGADIFKPVKIGNNVHIGPESKIMPGVEIGDNVIIGVGAVVTKNIPNNSIAVGTPARVIESIDEYYEKNKDKYVDTKYMSAEEKKQFILRELYHEGAN